MLVHRVRFHNVPLLTFDVTLQSLNFPLREVAGITPDMLPYIKAELLKFSVNESIPLVKYRFISLLHYICRQIVALNISSIDVYPCNAALTPARRNDFIPSSTAAFLSSRASAPLIIISRRWSFNTMISYIPRLPL